MAQEDATIGVKTTPLCQDKKKSKENSQLVACVTSNAFDFPKETSPIRDCNGLVTPELRSRPTRSKDSSDDEIDNTPLSSRPKELKSKRKIDDIPCLARLKKESVVGNGSSENVREVKMKP